MWRGADDEASFPVKRLKLQLRAYFDKKEEKKMSALVILANKVKITEVNTVDK